MNLDIIKYRLFRVVTVFSCSLLPFGCVQDDDVACDSESTSDNVSLQLKVDSAGDNNGTAPTDDEAKIHTLRVYAFAEIPQGDEDADKDGRLVGYYYTDKPAAATPLIFDMDITFYQKGTQQVNFYMVANEGAMSTPGVSKPFTQNTTEQELKDYTFTQLEGPVSSKGLPMYHQSSVTLNKAGSTSVPTFNLQRPIGKLEVFAAKPVNEMSELKITGLTLLESGTRARNYLMPQTPDVLKGITSISGDFQIPVKADVVIGNMKDDNKKEPGNFTAFQQSPAYLFENPWGSASWNTQGDEKGNVLQIDYAYAGDARTGLVYLPPIERNNYYTIYCLFHNEGKITVSCQVLPWNLTKYDDIVFDYPTYSNPITPSGWTGDPETAQFLQPTVYYSGEDNWDGSYSFKFSMTGPKGQHWKPTFYYGADTTPEDYEVSVWQGTKPIAEEKDGYLVSPDPYIIKVRATKPKNVGKNVSLGISYQPAWSDQAQLLLINGRTGALKWEKSEYAELIKIVQIEQPTTK